MHRLSLAAGPLLALSFVPTLPAQTCRVVADLNKTRLAASSLPTGSQANNGRTDPRVYVRCGNTWFFAAQTVAQGRELWRTDGTAAGTVLVKDIWPGPDSGLSGRSWVELKCCTIRGKPLLFFKASDGKSGEEVWRSDGTAAGTVLVADINPGVASSLPWNFECLGNEVFFAAVGPNTGIELWGTDGTAAGTRLVKDIHPGSTGSFLRFHALSSAGNEIYFQAWDGANGTELWKTRGTAASTVMVKDINPGSRTSGPTGFQNVGGVTVFLATGANGNELWRTDGTRNGTFEIQDINPGRNSSQANLTHVARSGSTLFFAAFSAANGTEVWQTDGTRAGTKLTADIAPGTSSSWPSRMFAHGNTLYVTAQGALSQGRELWKVQQGRATLLKEIYPGPKSGFPQGYTEIGGKVLFSAVDGTHGYELWMTDGTTQATQLLKDIAPGVESGRPDWFTKVAANRVIFRADDGVRGHELWSTDGTAAGTVLLKDVAPRVGSYGSAPGRLTAANGNTVYFHASDGKHGQEPHVFRNGKGMLLKDLDPGTFRGSPLSSFPNEFTPCGRLTFFSAERRGVTGREPYVTDGTPAGTRLLKDVFPGTGSSWPTGFACLGDRVVFRADDGTHGAELWISDGTPAGTKMLKDIRPGANGSFPFYFAPFRGRVFFSASDGQNNGELWSTDGTTAGTVAVSDIRSGTASARVASITVHRGRLYFAADDGVRGTELWSSDGTKAGTGIVKDIASGGSGSFPGYIVSCGDEIAFRARTAATGYELFASDGTGPGTRLVKDIYPGSQQSLHLRMMACGGKVFMPAFDGVHGRELWVSDLTANGTKLVKDIRVNGAGGRGSSEPRLLACVGDRLWFTADDGFRSRLWVTDGTTQGTRTASCRVAPTNMAVMGGRLYCDGWTTAFAGTELVEIAGAGPIVETFGQPCGPTYATMSSTPPRLGGAAKLTGESGPAGHVGLVLLAAPPQDPTKLPILRPGCRSFAFPPALILGAVLPPKWTVPLGIPNDPNLAGVTVVAQTWYVAPPALLPATTTNAVQLTPGR